MAQRKPILGHDGAYQAETVGTATIKLQRVTATAWRVEVSHSCPFGAVIDQLSRSWPTEATARTVARGLYRAFHAGMNPEQVIAALTQVVDEALDRAWQGGDGTGRQHRPIAMLTELRDQLRLAGERAEREARLAEMRDAIAADAPTDPDADRWAAFDAGWAGPDGQLADYIHKTHTAHTRPAA